jgi:tetratricopeptide (TPR) repeat protein
MNTATDTHRSRAADPEAVGDRDSASFLQQLFVSRASDLARLGAYDAAEQLIGQLIARDPSADALDLLARIRAQQGRLDEAKLLWTRAMRIAPAHGPAVRGLARIELLNQRAVMRSALGLVVDVAGTTLVGTADAMVVNFDFPLFERLVDLTPRARQTLAELGRQLLPHARQLTIEVIGYPEPGGLMDHVAGAVLGAGMARAGAVFTHLVQSGGLPEDAFLLKSLDRPPAVYRDKAVTGSDSPAPGAEIRLKKRTHEHE